MLPPLAASNSPNLYRRLLDQQFTGLLIRFFALMVLSWALQWSFIPIAQWHSATLRIALTNPFILLCISYFLISLVLIFVQMVWVNKRWLFLTASVIDALMGIGLLILYPNIALMGFAVSVIALLAMFQGLSARFILGLSLGLSLCAMAVAHIDGILVDSIPLPMHGLQALLVIFAVLTAWRFEKLALVKTTVESEINPISLLPRLKALHTSLHYLLPYHQRNKIPMSLLMISMTGTVKHPPTLQQFAIKLSERIRQSDVLVHMDEDHFIILLCDTSLSGASALAKDIRGQFADATTLKLTFAVSSILLSHTAIDPLLVRMREALLQAKQLKTDRIIFVNEEKLESISYGD